MRRLCLICILLATALSASAQIDLTGRIYHLDVSIFSKLDLLIADTLLKDHTYAKSVEGKELIKSLKAIDKALVSYVTVRFIDDKTLKFSAVSRYDESRAIGGGASYQMSNLMKKTYTNMSRTEKASYTLNGRTIKAQSKKMKKKGEAFTFELSDDGETLIYVTKFNRTKLPRKK